MTNQFPAFAQAVEARLRSLKGELFVVDALDLFETYIGAFPEGTNPIFRERTEHDCSCCKQFIRNVGGLVSLDGGKITTIWDVEGLPHPYDKVAAVLAAQVRQLPIRSVYRTQERKFGATQTVEVQETGKTICWSHFFCDVPKAVQSPTPDKVRGEIEATAQVLRRGLSELTAESFETVLDLINDKAIYRGDEHKSAVQKFQTLHAGYPRTGSATEKEEYVWRHASDPASRFRNTAIGTLLVDLSDGVELEKAVKSFEAKVAPENYKRPTAIVTAKMVTEAMKTLDQLGLESATQRRYARLSDVSVNNVLWVDNAVRGEMRGGLANLLMESVAPAKVDIKGAEPIRVEEFLERIVPQASTIDLLVENRHLGNFMSLTAPVHPDAGQLFRWPNGFAWSYDGDVTDSIKQRVKTAGGNTDAQLRISLAWFNKDDLDIHVYTPRGDHIYFGNKAGCLDVDMNAFGTLRRDAVENVSFRNKPADGTYRVVVNQYSKRESIDVGFVLEVESAGRVQQFSYDRAVVGMFVALFVTVEGGVVTSVKTEPGVVGGEQSTGKWGVASQTLVPVDTLMASPNHWDGQAIGNKHWFFLLRDCKNPGQARGIYNEFLKPELEQHRKVFELIGAKTKCAPSDDQLSGVGFSSTRADQAVVVVKGKRLNKAFNITF